MIRERSGKHNKTGAIGELVARKWLTSNGFSVIADNYQKKWGEIDIIAKQGKVIHFVEVKAVSYDTKDFLSKALASDSWRPEEQVTDQKMQKIGRTIETWLIENDYDGEWQIDIATVRLVPSDTYAKLDWIWNVVL